MIKTKLVSCMKYLCVQLFEAIVKSAKSRFQITKTMFEPVESCSTLDSFKGEVQPSDAARLILDDFTCTVHSCFSHHLIVECSCITHPCASTTIRLLEVSVLYRKKKENCYFSEIQLHPFKPCGLVMYIYTCSINCISFGKNCLGLVQVSLHIFPTFLPLITIPFINCQMFSVELFLYKTTMDYCTVPMFNIKYLVVHKVQVHNKAINYLVYGLCVCTGDNPPVEARGLSSRTDGQTIH